MRCIHNPALRYVKLAQLFGLLPFWIVPAEESNANLLPGAELEKDTGSKTGIKYKAKFSASLMTWCFIARIIPVCIILKNVIVIPGISRCYTLIKALQIMAGLSMCFSLTTQKALINSTLKIWSGHQETKFKFKAGVTVWVLSIFLMLSMKWINSPTLYDKIEGTMFVSIILIWNTWCTQFYKHLCSCMKIQVIKIQHRIHEMNNDDVYKLIEDVNKVCFQLLFLGFTKIFLTMTQ